MSWRTGVLWALLLINPLQADEAGPDFRDLQRRGDSQVRTGTYMVGSGLALLPLGAIAAIPVFHDGAFGITAADPGFAIFFAAVGGGLIHAGIPFIGSGSEKLERAAHRSAEDAPGGAEAGWRHYRRGWNFMLGGSATLLAAVPFAVVTALDIEKKNKTAAYATWGLGGAALGLMTIGVLEQHYSLHRFSVTARDARRQLRAHPLLALVPDLRWDGGNPSAGMRLIGTF